MASAAGATTTTTTTAATQAPPQHATAAAAANTIRLGSRSSKLALVQADQIVAALAARHPDLTFPVQTVMVRGDADKTSPFLQMAERDNQAGADGKLGPARAIDAAKNLWTEEMEIMLAAGDLDMLVHSCKDLPTVLPNGCVLGATVTRDDPRDALCVRPGLPYTTLAEFPAGSVVGTSSTRRKALLKRHFPELVVEECRGNVGTRLAKLDNPDGNFTAIIVAAAGLNRLNLQDRITSHLSASEFPYAVGQGALAVEVRAADARIASLLAEVEQPSVRWPVLAERALLRTLQGGCSSPVGVWSEIVDPDAGGEIKAQKLSIHLTGSVIHPAGTAHVTCDATATAITSDADAEALGADVAQRLLDAGAADILAQIRAAGATGVASVLNSQAAVPLPVSGSEHVAVDERIARP